MSRNRSTHLTNDTTLHEMWILFWEYEIPRMEARLNKTKLPPLPKDEFELETYKICEMIFNTKTYQSNRREWLSKGKNAT